MQISLVGINHRTAPVAIREKAPKAAAGGVFGSAFLGAVSLLSVVPWPRVMSPTTPLLGAAQDIRSNDR